MQGASQSCPSPLTSCISLCFPQTPVNSASLRAVIAERTLVGPTKWKSFVQGPRVVSGDQGPLLCKGSFSPPRPVWPTCRNTSDSGRGETRLRTAPWWA